MSTPFTQVALLPEPNITSRAMTTPPATTTLGEEKDKGGNTVETAPAQPSPASEIPNGGLVAWLQVVGAFFLFTCSW